MGGTEALVVIGTRPEAIKLAPVIWALRERGRVRPLAVITGQHRELLSGLPDLLDFGDAADLGLRPGPGPGAVLADTVAAIGRLLSERRSGAVVVQGDTTAALAGALAGFYAQIPVAHVEAGLRTSDPTRPFPEEAHRRMISVLATRHLAATEGARRNLLAAGIADDAIQVTGNPVVDALEAIREHLPPPVASSRPLVVVTVHRRESWGPPLHEIAAAVADVAREHPDVEVVVPAHPAPQVQQPLRAALDGIANARVLEPLRYDAFLGLIAASRLVLTDSGGIQEEAPSLGVPVLLLRDLTERPEAIESGAVRLVGTNRDAIRSAAREALAAGTEPRPRENPFGDGHAGPRIAAAVEALALGDHGGR